MAHHRTDDDPTRHASSTPAESTESTDISNDGPRQPRTEVDATDGSRPEPPAEAPGPAAEPDRNGDGTAPATAAETAGAPGATATPAGPAPKVGHDPVTDAVTTEQPAVPAGVPGLDAPAGPPAPSGNAGSTSAGTEAPGTEAPATSGGTVAPGTTTPPRDLADTTEMPRIDAPAAPSSGDSRPVYEVRAAAAKADPASGTAVTPASDAPATEAPAAEPPVTEQIPTVVERPSSARDEPTRVVLGGGGERPQHFRIGPAKPINTGEIPQVEDEPKRGRRLRGPTIAVLAPLVVVMLLIVAWAADTASLSGQVQRNVELAGRQIGGKSEAALPEIVAGVAAEQAERIVTIELADGEPYEASAATFGLVLDEDATTEAVIDMGRGDAVLARPLKWLKSFFSPREVPLQFSVTETQTAATLQLMQGADRTAPTDPSIQLNDGEFVMTPGQAGEGIDVSQVAEDLLREAEADTDGPITIRASSEQVHPKFTDDQAQQLADRANGLTADGITLKADEVSVQVPAAQLRSWIQPAVVDDQLDLAFDTEKATAELPALFGGLDAEPKNASMTLEGGVPKVVPAVKGMTCCGENAADLVWQGVQQEKDEVALEVVNAEPEITTAEVEGWGIKEPVGGSRGYQSGQELNGGVAPGFTTFHACCAPRVHNIHRIADLVRGTVIPPGGTFSVNDTVGKRTPEKGFVEAGAISEGIHVPEVGGGISQFATTTFNAAYFAGLDIDTYQAHSESFARYPRGREATMGFPNPDLVISNDTPYGVMIWTSYTDTSLTVTMYSTQYATAEQTGMSESMSGNCEVVTTTRTRHFPDGSTDTDTFRATYRPGEGKFC